MKATILYFFFLIISCGVIAAPPVVSSFAPTTGATASTITITGTGFTTATAVRFGGTAASSFTVISDTEIRAVVATGNSGNVQVVTTDGNHALAGFTYLITSGIISDFNGFWKTSGADVNIVQPDNSHHLLAVTVDGITYSTGVKDSILDARLVDYIPGNFKALPVASITGTTGTGSVFIALAKNVDRSASLANTANVSDYSVMKSLTDGEKGLDLGTGITNLPSSAKLSFQIFSIDPSKINDAEPDLILTQIADPSTGNDNFSLVDAAGNIIGNTKTQNMDILPKLGTYQLDLFTLTPGVPYNKARVHGVAGSGTNVTRDIRVASFKLSDFGITPANAHLVKALRIEPSSNSDYAFIAYNANSINLPPNVVHNRSATTDTICSGGTAFLGVLAAPVVGGALVYAWEEQLPATSVWNILVESSANIGVSTNRLRVLAPAHGTKYRVRVTEAGNANAAVSEVFTIIVNSPVAPSGVSITGGGNSCLNVPVILESTVTGGVSRFYQWQKEVSGIFENLEAENSASYSPPVNQTGLNTYRLLVSAGSGCGTPIISSSAPVNIAGISGITPAAVCTGSPVTLNASTTSGTVNWYAADLGGSSLSTNYNYSPGTISSTRTYFVAAAGCASALRVPVLATVYPTSAGGNVNGGGNVPPGVNSTTLTVVANTGSILKWQSSSDAFSNDINDISHTGNQLTVTNLSNDMHYRALVQSGTCAASFSATGSVTMFTVLAIHDKSLRVTADKQGALVQWTANNTTNVIDYKIERSSNGAMFMSSGRVDAIHGAQAAAGYKWFDESPLKGTSYYRIKEVSTTGKISYSEVVKFVLQGSNASITAYPNPVSGRILQLKFESVPAGLYQVTMFNTTGQAVLQQDYEHSGTDQVRTFALPKNMPRGTYKIKVGDRVFSIAVL